MSGRYVFEQLVSGRFVLEQQVGGRYVFEQQVVGWYDFEQQVSGMYAFEQQVVRRYVFEHSNHTILWCEMETAVRSWLETYLKNNAYYYNAKRIVLHIYILVIISSGNNWISTSCYPKVGSLKA